jgi:hypothetical protein
MVNSQEVLVEDLRNIEEQLFHLTERVNSLISQREAIVDALTHSDPVPIILETCTKIMNDYVETKLIPDVQKFVSERMKEAIDSYILLPL